MLVPLFLALSASQFCLLSPSKKRVSCCLSRKKSSDLSVVLLRLREARMRLRARLARLACSERREKTSTLSLSRTCSPAVDSLGTHSHPLSICNAVQTIALRCHRPGGTRHCRVLRHFLEGVRLTRPHQLTYYTAYICSSGHALSLPFQQYFLANSQAPGRSFGEGVSSKVVGRRRTRTKCKLESHGGALSLLKLFTRLQTGIVRNQPANVAVSANQLEAPARPVGARRRAVARKAARTAAALLAVAFVASPSPAHAAKAAKATTEVVEHLHVGQKIANYFRSFGLPDLAVLALISAMPVVELRGAVPVGVWMGLDPLTQVLPVCVLGNMVPIIPLLVLLRNDKLK